MATLIAVGVLAVGLAFIAHLMMSSGANETSQPEEVTGAEAVGTIANAEAGGLEEYSALVSLPKGDVRIKALNHIDGSFVFVAETGWFLFSGQEWVGVDEASLPSDLAKKYAYPHQYGEDHVCLLDE